jgi:hypothetical protein
MQIEGLGGGVMLLVAAALWFVYLLPTWLRRREYLATERNAVRLQQTIRVMAEAAEVPPAVARERAARERLAEEKARAAAAPAPEVRTGNVRGARRTATLVLLASVVVALVASASSAWMLVAGCVGAGATAVMLLGTLATTRQVERVQVEVPVVRERVERTAQSSARRAPTTSARQWTPVPVPKPLYIDTPAPQTVAGSVDHVAAMRRAAAEAELALRDAPTVVPIEKRPAASAPSRFASMGRIEAAQTQAPTDLDAVLRKRRAG